jgi:SAM-dependent methyltransferase
MEHKTAASLMLASFMIFLAGCGQALAQRPQLDGTIDKDVPYVPTPQPVVEEMLRLAQVGPDDLVYDLGSGDGRIVITAAERYGARGVGVDIDPARVRESRANAEQAGVTERVRFIQGDLFEVDLSEATAVTLYLLSSVNLRLRPKLLEELRPGTPVVSHAFHMADWEPDRVVTVQSRTVYLWYIPARVAGVWSVVLDGPDGVRDLQLELEQTFQLVDGRAQMAGEQLSLERARLQGEKLSFTLTFNDAGQQVTREFTGRVDGDTITGTVEADQTTWTAKRTETLPQRAGMRLPRAGGTITDAPRGDGLSD